MSRNDLVDDLVSYFQSRAPTSLTETTKSWIFLMPDEVFKLKKAVRDDLQDLTPLRARHDNTLTEIDLNRRLAPDLYVGAVRVGRKDSGALVLDADGVRTVDWLVRMRRLPGDRMLDQQIKAGASRADLVPHLERVVVTLLKFYRSAHGSHLSVPELLTIQDIQLDLAYEVLLHPTFADHRSRFERVLTDLRTQLGELPDLIASQARAEAFVECHGDLRPEHICLTDPPQIFDCLEFNRLLRLADPLSEIIFLGMECEMLRADWIKPWLLERIASGLGVVPDPRLMTIYETCHAVARARLCLAHLLKPCPRTPEKWMPLGLRYLAIAEKALG